MVTNEEKAQSVLNSLNDDCYIHMNEETECAYKDGFVDGADYINNEYAEIIKQYYDYASKPCVTRRRKWNDGYLAALHDIFVACLGEEELIHYKLGK